MKVKKFGAKFDNHLMYGVSVGSLKNTFNFLKPDFRFSKKEVLSDSCLN